MNGYNPLLIMKFSLLVLSSLLAFTLCHSSKSKSKYVTPIYEYNLNEVIDQMSHDVKNNERPWMAVFFTPKGERNVEIPQVMNKLKLASQNDLEVALVDCNKDETVCRHFNVPSVPYAYYMENDKVWLYDEGFDLISIMDYLNR